MNEIKRQQSSPSHLWGQDSVQKLVYGLSHDMGAPLRSVVQFCHLLEKRLEGRLDEKERYWLQLICQGGIKAQAMVDALLRYSRLSTRHTPIIRFSLQTLVEAVIKEIVRQKCQQCRPIRSIITAKLPDVTGSFEHWQLLLSCIIENALLYQPKNDPTHTPEVQIHVDTHGDKTRITIDDNGIGVSESRWSELTRPFMRIHNERDYPGIGMGLSFCDRIAQLHNAHLSFGHSPLGGLAVSYTY